MIVEKKKRLTVRYPEKAFRRRCTGSRRLPRRLCPPLREKRCCVEMLKQRQKTETRVNHTSNNQQSFGDSTDQRTSSTEQESKNKCRERKQKD